MTRELPDSGLSVGRRRMARPMRENGLRARQKRRCRRSTDSHHAWPTAPNLLQQDCSAAGPDRKEASDISSIRTREGWLDRAVVIDLFARRGVGWAVADRLHREPGSGLINPEADGCGEADGGHEGMGTHAS